MGSTAFICGCHGLTLSADEARFIVDSRPWGLILFKRNVDRPEQVRRLCDRFRELLGVSEAPILIDQEGGRVQRLGPPHWQTYPAPAVFDQLPVELTVKRGLVRLMAQLLAYDLRAVGISIDCLPVLDVPIEGGHDVIGNRAYSRAAGRVGVLGRAAAEGLIAGGVLPTIKHLPGHGRAFVDSHRELPIVVSERAELAATDFLPFQMLSDMPIGMSAHVVFQAVDREHPATLSAKVIETIIRGHIGFDGLLLTDDLSMQALKGDLRARAEAAFRAGIDVVLHCNGDLVEAAAVAAAAPRLAGAALRRAKAALARIPRAIEIIDPVEGHAKLADALAVRA
jgi:beta-N-acetylhexosaminidase